MNVMKEIEPLMNRYMNCKKLQENNECWSRDCKECEFLIPEKVSSSIARMIDYAIYG